jgi:hypothetical protein
MTRPQKQAVKKKAKEISDSMETLEFIALANILYETAVQTTETFPPDIGIQKPTEGLGKPLESTKIKAKKIADTMEPLELWTVVVELCKIAKKRADEYFNHGVRILPDH